MTTLLIERAAKRAVTSLWDDRLPRLPALQSGDTWPLTIAMVDRIAQPFDSRLFTPVDLTSINFRVALGRGFSVPVGGTFTLTWGGDTTATLPADPSWAGIDVVLNNLDSIYNAGGVDVIGGNGFYVVTWLEVGARALITADAGSLVPASLIDIQRQVTGDSDTREVQIIRIVQSAAALAVFDTATASAGIGVSVVVQGDATHNHSIRVSLTGDIYDGTWTLATADSVSDEIGWDDSAAQIKRAVEAISGVGTGNVTVRQEDAGTYRITFLGTLGNQAISGLAVDGSNLVALPALSGTLDLSQPAVQMLLNGQESAVVGLEIESQLGTDPPEKILSADVLLKSPVLETAMTAPATLADLVGAQIATYSGCGTALTVNSTGTTDIAPAAAFIQWTQRVTVATGSGAFTRKFTLDTSKAVEGAKLYIHLAIAASSNSTVKVYNESISGTQLGDDITGDSDNAQSMTVVYGFENGAWQFEGYME